MLTKLAFAVGTAVAIFGLSAGCSGNDETGPGRGSSWRRRERWQGGHAGASTGGNSGDGTGGDNRGGDGGNETAGHGPATGGGNLGGEAGDGGHPGRREATRGGTAGSTGTGLFPFNGPSCPDSPITGAPATCGPCSDKNCSDTYGCVKDLCTDWLTCMCQCPVGDHLCIRDCPTLRAIV